MGDFKRRGGFDRNRSNDRRPGFGNRGGGFSRPGGENFRRPEMHRAICSKCGQPCEVPFRPNGQKPLYCNNCFNDQTRSAPLMRPPSFSQPQPQSQPQNAPEKRVDELKRQIDAVQSKLDLVLQMLEASKPKETPAPVEIKTAPLKKKAISKKTPPKKK